MYFDYIHPLLHLDHWPTKDHTLHENWQLCQQPSTDTSSQARGMIFGGVWLELAWVLCMLSWSLWVSVCNWPLVSTNYYFCHPPSMALTIFHSPLSQWSFNLGGWDCSIWNGALHRLLFSVCWPVVQSLWWLSSTTIVDSMIMVERWTEQNI